jgi:hypothetical protein
MEAIKAATGDGSMTGHSLPGGAISGHIRDITLKMSGYHELGILFEGVMS